MPQQSENMMLRQIDMMREFALLAVSSSHALLGYHTDRAQAWIDFNGEQLQHGLPESEEQWAELLQGPWREAAESARQFKRLGAALQSDWMQLFARQASAMQFVLAEAEAAVIAALDGTATAAAADAATAPRRRVGQVRDAEQRLAA